MAYVDYRHCDICDAKTFYDANLDHDWDEYPETGLRNTGALVVLCVACSTRYDIFTKRKEE